MRANVSRSRNHNTQSVAARAVAERGALYRSANSPKHMPLTHVRTNSPGCMHVQTCGTKAKTSVRERTKRRKRGPVCCYLLLVRRLHAIDAHLSTFDGVEEVALFALLQNDGAGRHGLALHAADHNAELISGQVIEQNVGGERTAQRCEFGVAFGHQTRLPIVAEAHAIEHLTARAGQQPPKTHD